MTPPKKYKKKLVMTMGGSSGSSAGPQGWWWLITRVWLESHVERWRGGDKSWVGRGPGLRVIYGHPADPMMILITKHGKRLSCFTDVKKGPITCPIWWVLHNDPNYTAPHHRLISSHDLHVSRFQRPQQIEGTQLHDPQLLGGFLNWVLNFPIINP